MHVVVQLPHFHEYVDVQPLQNHILFVNDYYKEKNSEANEVKETQDNHVAEIIISKHRNGPTGKVFTVFIPKWGKFENYQSL